MKDDLGINISSYIIPISARIIIIIYIYINIVWDYIYVTVYNI